jgi:DNA-binding transcriptional LysR family regulator
MELRDIEYFAVVAEHRNLGRAAEALGLSPTALSKSLRRLEESLQAKLVHRTAKGVELTVEGDALLSHVRGLRLSLADIASEVSDLAQGRVGRVRIGASPSMVVEHLLANAFAALMKTSPKVTLAIMVEQAETTRTALRDGKVDLVISTLLAQPDETLVQEFLIEDNFVPVAPATHPLAKKRRPTIQDLATERWILSPANTAIRRRFDQLFAEHGITPPVPVAEISPALLKLRMAATSDLLCFQSAWWLDKQPPGMELVRIPVPELTFRRRIGVIYRKVAYLPPAARRFIELLRAMAKEMAAGKRSA